LWEKTTKEVKKMLELTEYEEKLISAVLAQMRIDNEELKVKNDYAIIMSYLFPHVNLTKAMNRI
jgi:hypothetical protein